MSAARRVALALALFTGVSGTVALVPSVADAQAGQLVVQMPFTGNAGEGLLRDAEDIVRNVLLARGARGPDRTTVRGALGVSVPTDAEGVLDFGRSMGATHVLSGTVTPLTGQFDLTLRLWDVATGRFVEQQRNVGEGEEQATVTEMVTALFAAPTPAAAPVAAPPTADPRVEAERRRQAELRAAEERRRRDEAERNRRIYVYGEGGLANAGLGLWTGGVLTSFARRDGQPAASPVFWGMRIDGGYLLLPSVGLSLGGAFMFIGSPTNAAMLGATARIAWPTRGPLPLRGTAGAVLGLYQGFTGAQTTSAWLGVDVRAEYDVVPAVTLFAGLSLDGFPGVMSALSGAVGVAFHFGDRAPGAMPRAAEAIVAPAPASNPNPDAEAARSGPTQPTPPAGPTGFGRSTPPADSTDVEVITPSGSPP